MSLAGWATNQNMHLTVFPSDALLLGCQIPAQLTVKELAHVLQ